MLILIISLLRLRLILSHIVIIMEEDIINFIIIVYNSIRIDLDSEIFIRSFTRVNDIHQFLNDFIIISLKKVFIKLRSILFYEVRNNFSLIHYLYSYSSIILRPYSFAASRSILHPLAVSQPLPQYSASQWLRHSRDLERK